MKYPAPDGHIMESLPYPQEVTYTCVNDSLPDGIYEHMEGTTNVQRPPFYVEFVHVTRLASNGQIEIKLVEFSEQEVSDYVNSNKQNI